MILHIRTPYKSAMPAPPAWRLLIFCFPSFVPAAAAAERKEFCVKILVIPDIHLKPWIFDRAEEILRAGKADMAVCLMDIADDWNKEYDLTSYEQTYDAAISFAREFPDTFWCYGNPCDVFSTFQNGKPIGTQVFPVIDTEKGELSAELQTVGDQE